MRIVRLAIIALLANTAFAADAHFTESFLMEAWPSARDVRDVGRGVAVVFSPDLSVPGNCHFYQALGFACFEGANWSRILDAIGEHIVKIGDRGIRTLVLETHGTNGHGLKLQTTASPMAERSYISVGGLLERVEPLGIRYIILGSCNSARLLRPEIYRTLNREVRDKLFLPATAGIIDASAGWDRTRTQAIVITPAASNVEMTVVGHIGELGMNARAAITDAAARSGIGEIEEFAISDLLMQIVTRDPALRLKRAAPTSSLSHERSTALASERLFHRFVAQLERLASSTGEASSSLP